MNPSATEACHKDLFADIDELNRRYPEDTVRKVLRVRDMYLTMLKTPSMTDSTLIKTFTARYKVSRPTAYSDLAVVKGLLPMLGKEARDFHKWRASEMLLETYRIASAKMDVRTMERVSATYAKVHDVSRPEEEKIPIDQVVPQPWIPTDDPSVLGLPPLPNREEKIKKLLEELRVKDPDIMDISYEEADIDPLYGDPLPPD